MFITRGPVDSRAPVYIERTAELNRLLTWAGTTTCVGAMLGSRQTGKSTLFHRLSQAVQDGTAVAFVNLESMCDSNLPECYMTIAQELLSSLHLSDSDGLSDSLPTNNREFLTFLARVSAESERVRIVILMEELGVLPEDIARSLAHTIRAIFSDRMRREDYRRISFILSGSSELLDLTKGRNSPLKNVVESIYLPDFTETESATLLEAGFAQSGSVVPKEVARAVFQWTRGQPYLTQMLGSQLEAMTDPSLSLDSVRSVVDQLLQTEDNHLPHVRRSLDAGRPALWKTVRNVVAGQQLPFSRSNPVTAELELIGILRNSAGRCAMRNDIYTESVKGWIAEESRQPSHGPRVDIADLRGKIDFGIITIREDEFNAVLQRLHPPDHAIGFRRYEIGSTVTTTGREHMCAAVRLPEQGEGRGQQVARDLIEDLAPACLLLIGIGGAVPSPDFSLGDVVCATRVHDFSVRAVKDPSEEEYNVAGGPMHPGIEALLASLPSIRLTGWNSVRSIRMKRPLIEVPPIDSPSYYGNLQWRTQVRDALMRNFPQGKRLRLPQCTARSVISTDALIKSSRLVRQWQKAARSVAAVEMELGGIYLAARQRQREYPILAIRGISDVVGLRRDEDWTTYACQSAAAFAFALIRSGAILPVLL